MLRCGQPMCSGKVSVMYFAPPPHTHIRGSCCPSELWGGGRNNTVILFVQKRFLCCTFTLPLVKAVANMRLGGGERSLLLYKLYIFFLFLLAHEPAALEEHIMELKHLNDCESQLQRPTTFACATVPNWNSLVLYPDRDYFPVIQCEVLSRPGLYFYCCLFVIYPDRVLQATRPGLFPYTLYIDIPTGFIALDAHII